MSAADLRVEARMVLGRHAGTPFERLMACGLMEQAAEFVRPFGVTLDEVLSRRRLAPYVRARHALWVELRSRGYSLPELGWFFDRDHTTILAAVQKARVQEAS